MRFVRGFVLNSSCWVWLGKNDDELRGFNVWGYYGMVMRSIKTVRQEC